MHDKDNLIEELGDVRFQAVSIVDEIVDADNHEDYRYPNARYHNVKVAIT